MIPFMTVFVTFCWFDRSRKQMFHVLRLREREKVPEGRMRVFGEKT
jgi:hypothetical protein